MALEAIVLPRSWSDRRNHTADCVADRVAALVGEETRIFDKATQRMRAARPADVAVLCYRHQQCSEMAAALRARGLPVRVQSDGWLGAPATRVARAAIALVADPDDRLAALTLLTLGPARMVLADALNATLDGTLNAHPSLAPVIALAKEADFQPVGEITARVVDAIELRDWAAGLAEPAQALADLTRLEAEARVFDTLAEELKRAAGFHGAGPQVFLGWIAAQTDREWDRHPDAAGWTAPGVEVVTWHSAKGREWPITVVSGLDQKIAERPGTLRTEFDSFDDLDDVLSHAGVRWHPDFAAPETQQTFADALIASDEASAARELYVAVTRARDRLVFALPAEPSGEQERPQRMVDMLRDRAGLHVIPEGLEVCGRTFPVRIVEEPKNRAFPAPEVGPTAPIARFGALRPTHAAPSTPWRRSPSQLIKEPQTSVMGLTEVPLGPRIAGIPDDFDGAAERGSAWHLAWRVLAARPECGDRKSQVARR